LLRVVRCFCAFQTVGVVMVGARGWRVHGGRAAVRTHARQCMHLACLRVLARRLGYAACVRMPTSGNVQRASAAAKGLDLASQVRCPSQSWRRCGGGRAQSRRRCGSGRDLAIALDRFILVMLGSGSLPSSLCAGLRWRGTRVSGTRCAPCGLMHAARSVLHVVRQTCAPCCSCLAHVVC
jgi:hypothetical protein